LYFSRENLVKLAQD